MNSLIHTDPRLGYCYYGTNESDRLPAMLIQKENVIELSVLVNPCPGPNNPAFNWFSYGAIQNDEPIDNRIPKSLTFIDNKSKSMLINCKAVHVTFKLQNPGLGKIECTHIAHDIKNGNYEKISGLRSQSSLFKKWTKSSNFTHELTRNGSSNILHVTSSSDSYHSLSEEYGVGIAFDWSRFQNDYGFELQDIVYLQTESKEKLPWKEHSHTHRKIYALAEISSWKAADIFKTYAKTSEDPANDQTSSDKWVPCQTHGLPLTKNINSNIQFLFDFHHLPENGIDTWIKLYTSHKTGISTFLSILHSNMQLSPSNLIQSGIAFESIGKTIAREQNYSDNKINKMKYIDFLNIIYCDIEVPPFIERYDWSKTTREIYTSLKHAKRDNIHPLEIANNLLDSIQIFRFWIASRLNIPTDQIKLHANINNLNKRYDTIYD